ncbi:MAG TPA: type II toxin-antitoxin system RelE/ParE family toxin [Lachnospiraceae bacterium]|nr:type II toxin-antitoxin system RelE/ParE family toxin [Lachnospiraceae bacterium]
MEFKVVLSRQAQIDFRNITHYLLYDLRNEQAAISVTNDMEHTIEQLSYMAGGLKLCDDPRLRDLGYRTIHFKRHNYFMLYRIQDDTVYVDAIYHDLQNYEDDLQ